MPNLMSVSQVAPISMIPAITPEQRPTNKTHSHPDQASWAPRIKSQKEFFFFLTICLCRIRSLAMSLCQSMVWKSSYCPIPGSGSSSTEGPIPPAVVMDSSSPPAPLRLPLGPLWVSRPLALRSEVVPVCWMSIMSSSELFTEPWIPTGAEA